MGSGACGRRIHELTSDSRRKYRRDRRASVVGSVRNIAFVEAVYGAMKTALSSRATSILTPRAPGPTTSCPADVTGPSPSAFEAAAGAAQQIKGPIRVIRMGLSFLFRNQVFFFPAALAVPRRTSVRNSALRAGAAGTPAQTGRDDDSCDSFSGPSRYTNSHAHGDAGS